MMKKSTRSKHTLFHRYLKFASDLPKFEPSDAVLDNLRLFARAYQPLS